MKNLRTILLVLVLCWPAAVGYGAIGCTLNNPAQDLKFLFPEVTSFKEEIREFRHFPDGQNLYSELKDRLGTDLDPVYEAFATPYTVYTVYKGNELIGIVHGVNVPGRGGVIQVFLATDPKTGQIGNFFFQRLESPEARSLKNKEFRKRFNGLTLADFYKHDYFRRAEPESKDDKLQAILESFGSGKQGPDFAASLRGVRKNLILLDMFIYNRLFEPFFKRTAELLNSKGREK
ncbi:MAG TPA: hypothetical protein PLM07_09990 [Candidatus Rifleibacterium sp.]|nr:hypothetical protein [Candidatus Rifleibacterium sp.]HPT46218.1 hypothetical protein [Candidatus Rifleibacterium sp.]